MMLKRTLFLTLIALLLVSGVPFALAQDTATEQEMADDGLTIDLELVVDGLVHPLGLTHADDDSGRLFVFDQTGQIWILDENGTRIETPFLDLTERMVELNPSYDERGLLGLAFHPDYASNGRFFVYYGAPLREGAPAGWNHTSHVSEFMVSEDDANVANADSERIILQVDQPQANHNGGQIAFGPDGYLYVPLGDGGGANDVDEGHTADLGNAQDTSNLLGSILRLDVDGQGPYDIPADNAFVDSDDVLPEIYAYGFRNPYRMSFDAGGDRGLYVGDAGQNQWEEVNLVEAGGNYGWNIKEGTHCFDAQSPDAQVNECANTGAQGERLIDPIIEYQNANVEGGLGVVVIGGNVYRGSAIPEFEGRYIFGDWSTGWDAGQGHLLIATPSMTEGALWEVEELSIASGENGGLDSFLLSFGEDADLELYVLTTNNAGPSGNTGAVYKMVPAGDTGAELDDTQGDIASTVSPTATMTDTTGVDVTATPEVTATDQVTTTEETTSTVGTSEDTAGTVGATQETTGTVGTDEPRTLPVTGDSTQPWTAILLVGGGLAVLLGGAFLMRRRQAEDSHNQ